MAAKLVDLLDLVQLQRNLDEAEHVEAQPLAVEQGRVAAHVALLLQPPDARVHGRRRQVEPARQLGVGQAGIALQFGQDLAVEFVKDHRC